MSGAHPATEFDSRFSDPKAEATPWDVAGRVLQEAELYWITTVRRDGRPHVTPLVGVWVDDAMHFATGPQEQKAVNLQENQQVAVTTGSNTWAEGIDVVVEGIAVRLTDNAELQHVADAYFAKYGDDWAFEVGDGTFGSGDDAAYVFRIQPAKVLAFAKQPHAQTRYRFAAA
jgi:hypothetical protein